MSETRCGIATPFCRLKTRLFWFLLFVLFPPYKNGFAQSSYTGQTVEQILAMPSDSINLGIACLVLAKDAYPKLNVDYFNYCIDYMVRQIRYLNQGRTDPLARIGLLNTYLFRPGWWNDSVTFTYNLSDLEADSTNDQFLNGYIATKHGSCVTMSMLYLVLAQRLGWPIKPVRSAKHFYCRYIKKGFRQDNIEATCGGGFIPTWRYAADAGEPKRAIKNGVYEKVLTNKQYLASLLEENARYFLDKKKELDEAIYYTRLSIKYDSTNSGAYWDLGELYRKIAIQLDSIRFDKIQELKASTDVDEILMQDRRSQVETYTPLRRPATTSPEPAMPQAPTPSMFGQSINSIVPGPVPQSQVASRRTFDENSRQRYQEAIQDDPGILLSEIQRVNGRYGKQIMEFLALSHYLKAKSKSLGIVLRFPTEFFIKQAESIAKFKRTGEY
jgi:Transglutaminase-like superfamily